jgi:hypothetical protein
MTSAPKLHGRTGRTFATWASRYRPPAASVRRLGDRCDDCGSEFLRGDTKWLAPEYDDLRWRRANAFRLLCAACSSRDSDRRRAAGAFG